MNTRGLMELIVLNIGLDLGVISPTLFAMMVLMALVTTLATTPVLRSILGPVSADDELFERLLNAVGLASWCATRAPGPDRAFDAGLGSRGARSVTSLGSLQFLCRAVMHSICAAVRAGRSPFERHPAVAESVGHAATSSSGFRPHVVVAEIDMLHGLSLRLPPEFCLSSTAAKFRRRVRSTRSKRTSMPAESWRARCR